MAACDSPECLAAMTAYQRARNEILSLCAQIAQLRADVEAKRELADRWLKASAALAALAAALVLFLPFPLNLWVGGGLFTAALGFLVAGLVVLAEAATIEGQISKLQDQMVGARDNFDKAVADFMGTCDQECWPDSGFDQPSCP